MLFEAEKLLHLATSLRIEINPSKVFFNRTFMQVKTL